MPHVTWPLLHDRPSVQVVLALGDPQTATRDLLADTGAGSNSEAFELILTESDCRLYGALTGASVFLSGAFVGLFSIYNVIVQIPALGFVADLPVVGVPTGVPEGFQGTACFRFLNRFDYGNFGRSDLFGLVR
jgi:hypothetical protein